MSQRHRGATGATKWDSLPDPGPRFQLGERLGMGVSGEVFQATDLQGNNLQVAVKIQKITEDNWEDLEEEYAVLKNHSSHPNLPDFYGAYCKKSRDGDQLWLVMEFCEGGPIIEVVRALYKSDKKLCELHLAYILKDVIKAVIYLHQNHIMHRDIRGSNILLTKRGEIKLVDFGLSRELRSTMGKRGSTVGSPCWMAPEVVTSEQRSHKIGHDVYDNRVDTWAMGITAIELADGRAPFESVHPTRALFQIVSNPPPTLNRPSIWSQLLNDFISECLVKDPQNRPVVMELIEHPFITQVPENATYLQPELKSIMDSVSSVKKDKRQESVVRGNFLKSDMNGEPEMMYLEDLAAMENLTEDLVIDQLKHRLRKGSCYTFLGDVLLFINPNENLNIYSQEIQSKYMSKSRSENRPHIFAVADCAYQDVLHHNEPQHIVLSGESMSGKSANMMHALRHLLWLGKGNIAVGVRILSSINVIHALGNACTPLNGNSTRHVLNTLVTFTTTGKVSGAIFMLFQLERWRVTSTDRRQGNFHIFYYFYDYVESHKDLSKFHLDSGRRHRYLRSVATPSGFSGQVPSDPHSASSNSQQFEAFLRSLSDLEFGNDNIETFKKIMAAIILLGEIRFRDGGGNKAEVENPNIAGHVAQLLSVDEKKFSWALVNYCMITKGNAVKMQQSPEEAELARDALSRALYARVVDWLVNFINLKLSYSRAVFGDRHAISVLDLFGFECFQNNGIEQLFVNSLNEQLQFHYTQRLFAWEMQERLEDEVKGEHLTFYDNRPAVDVLMGKPDGVMWLVDEATRTNQRGDYIIDSISTKKRSPYCVTSGNEFSVAHYTGKVTYDASEMPEKNRDFVPPEVTETMRKSTNDTVRIMFTNQLSKTGNMTDSMVDVAAATKIVPETEKKRRASKWNAALVAEKQSLRSYNTSSKGQFSQTRRMRTAATTFRAVCLEVLRSLNVGGTHFVRCLRAELTGQPRGFQTEVVRQQLRALSVVDTIIARQRGYPCRVVFDEFLRRYKFLAFDFDETVDMTGDNCRLLMVRLKMEGYAMGKTKVYLKYYNEEYLARLYETQVKKIVKVQAMMRSFLARKKVTNSDSKAPGSMAEDARDSYEKPRPELKRTISEQEAAVTIQSNFKGYKARKEVSISLGFTASGMSTYDPRTTRILRKCARRWRKRTLFQTLLLYRNVRHQDLVYFCQQVHVFNQAVMEGFKSTAAENVPSEKIKNAKRSDAISILGRTPVFVKKVPYQFQMLPFVDTSFYCDPKDAGIDRMYSDHQRGPNDYDTWDAPLRRNEQNQVHYMIRKNRKVRDQGCQTGAITTNSSGGTLQKAQHASTSTNHIQTPYRRELMDTQPKMPKKLAPRYTPPNVNGVSSNPIEVAAAKRNANSMNSNFEPKNINARSGGTSSPAGHVKELKNLGRDMPGGDEGTFNFQSMLRKTNYSRGSMKRNGNEGDDNMWEKSATPDVNKSGPSYSAVVKKRHQGPSKNSRRHELAPGVIVEGEVADL